MILSDFFLWFVLYSVVGWIMETILCSIDERKLVRRGFLYGPYCPIYGAGSVLCLLLLGKVENPFALFFASMLLCGVLEYATGWLLERAFHQKWWDYSDMPLNLNGRICLFALLGFGTLIVLLIKVIHPFVLMHYNPLFIGHRIMLARAVLALLLVDITVTVARLKGIDLHMESARAYARSQFAYAVELKDRVKLQWNEASVRLPPSPRQLYRTKRDAWKNDR